MTARNQLTKISGKKRDLCFVICLGKYSVVLVDNGAELLDRKHKLRKAKWQDDSAQANYANSIK